MSGKEVPHHLLEVLNKAVNEKIESYDVVIEDNDMKGENFLGEIIFVSLKNKKSEERLSFVIKQSTNALKQMDCFSDIYVNEIRLYHEIWPVLQKFQEGYSIGFDKIPKSYGFTIDDDKIGGKLVMEDLRENQFKLYNKTIPLDEKHYRLIFKNYGIFHAISFAYRNRYPDHFNNLTMGLTGAAKVVSLSERLRFQFKAQLEVVIALFDKKEDEDIRKALEKEVENNNFLRHFARKERTSEDIVVLTHGDCWSNNFMFKYDENDELVDMRMLDFQMVNPNSPVKDLSYVLYSGASKGSLDNLDDYLKIYHESFTETLKKLESELEGAFTFEKLKEEWKRYCMFGVIVGLYIWRLKFVVKSDLPDYEDNKTENRLFDVAPDKMEDYKTTVLGLVSHLWENKFL